MQEKISINITTYNRKNLLERCIKSIIKQNYKNLEIIIIDDCSTDGTRKVVKKYQEKDKRIKYIRHSKNLGLAKARNTGVKNSTGNYIAFVDDDDKWLNNDRLNIQISKFSEDKRMALVCGGIKRIKKDGNARDELPEPPKNLKKHLLKRNGIIHTSTTLIKKKIIEEIGFFDEKLKRGIDSDIYRRIVLKNYKIFFVDKLFAIYHEDVENRITLTKDSKSIKDSINVQFYTIKKYFKYFLIYPGCLIYRIRIIIKYSIKFLKNE